jgi:N-acetylmuramoyl-L-alanine amidase
LIGLAAATAVLAGCGPTERPKIAELEPYVGRYPRGLPPLPPKPVVKPTVTSRALAGATIVVDAGHGGHDPGARGVSAVSEKSINLNLAIKLAGLLRSRGAKVVTTRERDVFIPLDDRAATADRMRADLFISIHADSSQRSSVSGTTIYISRNASGQSEAAARCIATALEHAGIECRGVHGAGYRVLVGHSRPAVLVECGFLTNRDDAQRLSTSAYQSRVAEAIANGVADHFKG